MILQKFKNIIKKHTSETQRRVFRKKIQTLQWILEWYFRFPNASAPIFLKRRMLKKYAKKYNIKFFFESGTAGGDTVNKFKNFFKKIISVELDNNLFLKAQDRFKFYNNIKIVHGDSGELMGKLISEFNSPILFWLDGHYSGGGTSKGELFSPIMKEIDTIINHSIKNHVVLIDDARCFNGTEDYPDINFFETYIKEKIKGVSFHITNDVIVIEPARLKKDFFNFLFKGIKEMIIFYKQFLKDFFELEIFSKLPAPSAMEKGLIVNFKKQMKNTEPSVPGRRWKFYVDQLKKYASFFDPRNFLRWSVIKSTMSIDTAPLFCLKELQQSPEWPMLWKNALVEDNFGSPIEDKNLKESSGTLIHHAFHLYNLKEATGIDFNEVGTVVEFGGGYGSMCRLIRRLNFKGNYILYDLPEFIILQDFYLKGIGENTINGDNYINEKGSNILVNSFDNLEKILSLNSETPKLFIATWSISESPLITREQVLNIVKSFDYFLFAYQPESDGVDNILFFEELKQKFNNVVWSKKYINFWQSYYLMGKK